MYSHEIDRLLKIRQNIISCAEYLEILSTSPQINYVKYDNYNETIEMKTEDNYNFKVKIKYKDTKK